MDSPVPYIYPQKHISWKGKTFKQITTSIEKNKIIDTKNEFDVNLFFRSMPLPIYRRNINIKKFSNSKYRVSSSIDELNMPGSTITTNDNYDGLVNILDINISNNSYTPTSLSNVNTTSTNSNNCLSQETNAKRRVRSAGMIRKSFKQDGTNNINYCVNTNQYLQSRTRSFDTNQYNYIRQGSALVKPGDSLSKSNIYTSNTNSCSKYNINKDVTIQYQWIDSNYRDVIIPQGFYSIEDLNLLLHNTMISNTHYLIDSTTKTSIFFLNMVYNTSTGNIELQSNPMNSNIYDYNSRYIIPIPPGLNYPLWYPTFNSIYPVFILTEKYICDILGFSSGAYPPNIITDNNYLQQTQVLLMNNQTIYIAESSFKPLIYPNYIKIFYKPSNSQFATQGAVSSSSLVTRKKYDTITDAAYKTNGILNVGTATMNALAYSGTDSTYTIKDKKGYPIKKTPVISKYTGELCEKYASKISNMT